MDSVDAAKIKELQHDIAELARVNQDLLDILILTARRLEELSGAASMDDARLEIRRLDHRLQRFLSKDSESGSPQDPDDPHSKNRIPNRIPRN